MGNDLPYIIKVSAAMAVFWMTYRLVFRKEKQFLFNRVYLLGALLISYVIPLFSFRISAPATMATGLLLIPDDPAPAAYPGYGLPGRHLVLSVLLYTGSGIALIRLACGHLRAFRLLQKTDKRLVNGVPVRVSPEDIPTFTYFRELIIPSRLLESPYLPVIISHEQVHIRERHTLDLCLAEILCLFQWFNPFAWLLRNAVRDNLEFLTDNTVICSVDPKVYQLSMVNLASKYQIHPFPSAFNQSQLKKRIIMMQTKKQSPLHRIKQTLVIPVVTLLILTLSGREFKAESRTFREGKTISGKVTDQATGAVLPGVAVLIKGTTTGTITDQYGTYLLTLDTDDPVLVYSFPGYEKKEIAFDEQNKLDVELVKSEGTILLRKDSAKVTSDGNPLIIVDGKKLGKNEVKNLDELVPPDDIESVSVIKNKPAIDEYGEEGKDGVILITTKKKQ